ncbi:MAG: signal peptide peptidase SppA [Holophagales bacterium]|jgi:protease-4|nr:signal peptide peptidase SppA [Holophagales bacterium]
MKSFFQSCLGTMFALIMLVGGVFALFIVFVKYVGPQPPSVPNKAILVLSLDRSLPDSPSQDDPTTAIQKALLGNMKQDLSLPVLINALDKATADPKISCLFITGNLESAGAAAMLELKQALERFKDKKPVISYNQTWGRGSLYLCAGLGKMMINPLGVIDVSAPTANLTFFSRAFDKYGVQVQVTKVGKYKSAVEPFTSDRMSPENREQIRAYLEEIWDGIKTGIAKGRGVEPAVIQQLADTKGLMSAKEAQSERLVDLLTYYDEILDELKRMTGSEISAKTFPQIDIETYARTSQVSQKVRNRIAIVVAEGDIVDGDAVDGSGKIGGDSFAQELRALRMNKDVKAVVMRVNSPGGSAMASDVIQREIIALKKDKPVIVSMGNLAASGGYWISTFADRIFAEPGTLTGSIGVFGIFPNAEKLAANHGITFDSVQMARLGNPSLVRAMTPAEMERGQALVDFIYDQFLEKVSTSRGIDKKAVHEIAQGRVWTGRKALELKLVDEIGGLDAAVKHAAQLAKIGKNYRIDNPETSQTSIERLIKRLGGSDKRKLIKASSFDTAQNELESALLRLRSLNDPVGVYALAPVRITIK